MSQVYKLSVDEKYDQLVNNAKEGSPKVKEVGVEFSIDKITNLAIGETFAFVYELKPGVTINKDYIKSDRFNRKVYNIYRDRTVYLEMLHESLKLLGNAFLSYDVIFKDAPDVMPETINKVFIRARKNDKGTINVSLFYSKY